MSASITVMVPSAKVSKFAENRATMIMLVWLTAEACSIATIALISIASSPCDAWDKFGFSSGS